ncbi:MAG: hypothetical protein KGD66_05875 [Candidatus Lokiarchaeota archaeon]|nr:hypothetical protein [Candidatus Lokiarchaeota archaeon]
MEEEETEGENEFILNAKELEVFYEVLFKRIMDIVKKPEVDSDPFGRMITILSQLSGIFSFKSMISLIPELVANAMKYGMMVEKAYEVEEVEISDNDAQGMRAEEIDQEKRQAVMQKDLDKLNLYL